MLVLNFNGDAMAVGSKGKGADDVVACPWEGVVGAFEDWVSKAYGCCKLCEMGTTRCSCGWQWKVQGAGSFDYRDLQPARQFLSVDRLIMTSEA